MKSLFRDIKLLRRIVTHPGAQWRARFIAGCTVGYLFSPIQLIPSFIPVIGQLDDLVVVYIGVKLAVRMVPQSVLTECMEPHPNR